MIPKDMEIKGNILRPGDTVYVASRTNGQLKPAKVRVGEVAVILAQNGCSVQVRSESGAVLPDDTYPDPWKCQKAIDILEKYRKIAEQELDTLQTTEESK